MHCTNTLYFASYFLKLNVKESINVLWGQLESASSNLSEFKVDFLKSFQALCRYKFSYVNNLSSSHLTPNLILLLPNCCLHHYNYFLSPSCFAYHPPAPGQNQDTGHRERMSDSTMADIFQDSLVRAECVRCPWLLAETKVATILGKLFLF
jgi:hypothetical protein